MIMLGIILWLELSLLLALIVGRAAAAAEFQANTAARVSQEPVPELLELIRATGFLQ